MSETAEIRTGEDGERELVCPACGRTSDFAVRFCADCGFRFRHGEGDTAAPAIDLREMADPLIGRIVADRYRIVELIGRGGMGVVYRVEHTRIAKAMAMKLLHGELARDKEVLRRFRREAEAVSKLDHQNTVQVFDFGRAEGMTYLVMELLSGRDLGAVLAQEGTIPFARMAHVAVQICASVQQAHDRGIVHRDLKPENVRIVAGRSDPDFVKVLDFGLAKLRETEEQARASITREGFLVGTPYYMAPEHIRGDVVDARSDVYALGALMYKAVVGVPPHWAPTPVAVLTKHLNDDIVPPTARSPRRDLPPAADTILMRALEREPEKRYQSMRELREALSEYLASVGIDTGSGRITAPTELRTASGNAMKVATRGDVDRYERRLRFTSLATGLALLVAFVAAAGGIAWLVDRGGIVRLGPVGEAEPNDTPDLATPLAPGEGYSAFLGRRHDPTHGDADVYALDNTHGTPRDLRFEVSAIPNVDLVVELYRHDRADAILVVDNEGVGHGEVVTNFPIEATLYFLRVREDWEHVVYPTENISDPYTVRWDFRERGAHEERELNDDVPRADAVALGDELHAFVGWPEDRDVFCLAADVPAAVVEARGDGLDLVLTVHEPVTDREHVVNSGENDVAERWQSEGPVAAHTCVTVTMAEGATRRSEDGAYVLTVRAP